MSCSDNTPYMQLRNRLNRFLASPYYILVVMVLSLGANLFALELPVYTAFTLVAIYAAVLGNDLLPLAPLFLFCYITPSLGNNPGKNDQSVFSGTSGMYIAILGILIALAAGFYVIRNCKQFFRHKRALLPGLLALSVAYLLSGIGTPHYSKIAERNLLFAAMQAAALLLPYLLLSGGVQWTKARQDYLAWIGLTGGIAVTVQLLGCYLTQGVVVNGVIERQKIYTGWGMYNNMGFVVAMAIPFAFYLATKHRKGWFGIVMGSVLLAGTLLSCSRTSLLIGTISYCFCIFLMLHYAQNRKHNTVALVTVVLLGGTILLLFHRQLLQLFSDFLGMGVNPSSRDVFFREGLKLFEQRPLFGNSFYSPGYTPWDFSTVDSLSKLIPPRWHSTPLQLLVSCGAVGVCAYLFHRFQTIYLLVRSRSRETTFIGCAVGVLLLCSLFDCHFFNIGPTLFYSAALAFGECNKQI